MYGGNRLIRHLPADRVSSSSCHILSYSTEYSVHCTETFPAIRFVPLLTIIGKWECIDRWLSICMADIAMIPRIVSINLESN